MTLSIYVTVAHILVIQSKSVFVRINSQQDILYIIYLKDLWSESYLKEIWAESGIIRQWFVKEDAFCETKWSLLILYVLNLVFCFIIVSVWY